MVKNVWSAMQNIRFSKRKWSCFITDSETKMTKYMNKISNVNAYNDTFEYPLSMS